MGRRVGGGGWVSDRMGRWAGVFAGRLVVRFAGVEGVVGVGVGVCELFYGCMDVCVCVCMPACRYVCLCEWVSACMPGCVSSRIVVSISSRIYI